MVSSTGCESGSVSHVCVSLREHDPDGVPTANRPFSDDSMLSISGSTGLSPTNKVCRFGMCFN